MANKKTVLINSYLDTGTTQFLVDMSDNETDPQKIIKQNPNIHEVIYDEIKKEANQFKECRQYSEKTLIEKFSKIKEQVVKKIITDWKIVNTIVSFYIQTDPIISNYENIKIETTQQELPEILLLHFCKYLRIINLNLEIKQILTYQGVEL